MSKDSIRLFIAIRIPDHIMQNLASINKILQHPFIRWVPMENLHITLHFIGQTRLNEIPLIEEKIAVIASKTSSFTLTLEKPKVIKKYSYPVMIWAALQECEGFTQLALQLQSNLPGDNSKKPTPHITLARIKQGKKLQIPDLPEVEKTSFEIRNIELMESESGDAAPIYKVVERFELLEKTVR